MSQENAQLGNNERATTRGSSRVVRENLEVLCLAAPRQRHCHVCRESWYHRED
jgi:hypothetical protein